MQAALAFGERRATRWPPDHLPTLRTCRCCSNRPRDVNCDFTVQKARQGPAQGGYDDRCLCLLTFDRPIAAPSARGKITNRLSMASGDPDALLSHNDVISSVLNVANPGSFIAQCDNAIVGVQIFASSNNIADLDGHGRKCLAQEVAR